MATSLFSFSKEERLHLNNDFRKVFKRGGVWHNNAVTMLILPQTREKTGDAVAARLGIIISRKTAGAVLRNKLKRRMREIFRLNKPNFNKPADIVLIGKKAAAGMGYSELEKKILSLWRKAKLLPGNN